MMSVGIQIELFSMEIGPMCRPPVASATPSATPSSSTGNAHRTSSARETTASVTPRKYPASVPNMTARNVVRSEAMMPMKSELRAP